MIDAARAFARGQRVETPPPSLRVWAMVKAAPGLVTGLDVMTASPQLWAELEEYAAAESAWQEEQNRRSRRATGRHR